MITVILVTASSFGQDISDIDALFSAHGLKVVQNPYGRKLTAKETKELITEHCPVGLLAGTETITREILEDARGHLKVISRVGTGLDNIDIDAAAEMGISVFRTLNVLTNSVAELAMGLILSGLRFIPQQDRMIRQGQWRRYKGSLLEGKIVGIIGFGDIGQRVAKLLGAFAARVVFSDIHEGSSVFAQRVSLNELLQIADVISIHANGNAMILGANEFKMIPHKGIVLVNTARGAMVDEAALLDALSDGRIACACLDVFSNEPYSGPLCNFDNVILTPHAGSYAKEARAAMEHNALVNLLQGLHEAMILS